MSNRGSSSKGYRARMCVEQLHSPAAVEGMEIHIKMRRVIGNRENVQREGEHRQPADNNPS